MVAVTIDKASSRLLNERRRHVETRARPLASALQKWLLRYARFIVPREMSKAVRKVDDAKRLREELERILRLYGVRQLQDAAEGAASVVVPASAVDDFLETKELVITGLIDETREAIREDIRQLVREALSEQPQPGAGEIARRIRSSYFGPENKVPFSVSSERAALIARTELVQAENTGIVEGYKATGVDELEWLAYSSGSGDRHHERMNGVRVKLGQMFTTPLGNKLRYPGDPAAPIKETANCRCTVAPVRRR